MAITLGSNIASLMTQRRLAESSNKLSKTFERLSSGLRINRAADDAAGLAIASSLNADRRVLAQGIRNLNDGVSLLSIADAATAALSDIVIRVKELATQAANGTFSTQQRQALDDEAHALSQEYFRISRAAEFNGMKLFDGSFQELRLQGGYGTEASMSSSLGGVMGDGTFRGATSYLSAEPDASHGMTLGDINGDGILDVVSVGYASGFATVRLGVGDGSFGESTSYTLHTGATPGATHSVVLADLNQDGALDLIALGRNGAATGTVLVKLNTGNGIFGDSQELATGLNPQTGLAISDINGDGIADLLTGGTASSNAAEAIAFGRGDGTFGSLQLYAEDSVSAYTRDISVGDVNGDGIKDLVFAYYGDAAAADGYAAIRLGNGDGTFAASTSYTAEGMRTRSVELWDLNKDGALDLITAGKSDGGDGYATVRLGTGDGTFGAATSYATESNWSLCMTAGDVNGDGTIDLVTAGTDDGTVNGYATVLIGQGDGTFAGATSYLTESVYSFAVQLGDLNRDGVLDLVTAGRSDGPDGYVTVRLGNTRPGVAPLLPFSLATIADARGAMSLMEQKLDQLSAQRSIIGSFQTRVTIAIDHMRALTENYAAAESRITDADIAEEASAQIRLQILQQAAAAVLAQANQQPALALQLL